MSLYRSPATLAREDEAREEITKHESCIDLLQSQINELMQTVYGIENEKRKHSIAIRQCLSVLSLANRLPTEVLVHIFEHAVFNGWTFGPLVVSQVCSAWRDAAKTPALWTQISVDAGRMESCARCNLWFSMARESLLDITFRTTTRPELALSAFSVINPKVENWRSFFLDSYTPSLANLVLSQITGPANNLEDVTIAVSDSTSTVFVPNDEMEPIMQHPRIVGLANALSSAPKLRKLTIISDQSSVWVGLPQITSLNLGLSAGEFFPLTRSIIVPEILDVLEASPNLRELSITIPREGERELVQVEVVGQPPRVVSLRHLRNLTLETDITIMLILKHFEAPNLQKLNLRCPDAKQSYASDEMRLSLQHFLDCSHPPLRSLHLYDVDISQSDFHRVFSELSLIEDIFLHGSDILDETLVTLASNSLLLPKLRTLEFRWCGYITGEAIEQVVRARSVSVSCDVAASPLQEVSLIACSGVKEEAILRISEMCRCRLKIRDEDDVCRLRGCCNNARYRVRFRSRVGIGLSEVQKRNIILV